MILSSITFASRRVQWGRLTLALAWMATALAAPGCSKSKVLSPTVDGGSGGDGAAGDAIRSDGKAGSTCLPDSGDHRKGKTEACTCDSDCQSGFCADGVCCGSACTDACKACNLPSSLGECSFVPAGVKPAHAPLCALSAPATCGLDGTCDGQGGCRKFVNHTECSPGTCAGESVTERSECDGNGKCNPAAAKDCYPYSCDPSTNQCAVSCTTDSLCSAGQKCLNQSCGKKLNGYLCPTGDDECASGHCADGYCCNVACAGTCVTCSQTGSLGRCAFIDPGLPDSACNASDKSTCGNTGLCDGFGACTLYPENTPCGNAICSAGTELNTARTCDGLGTCREAGLTECAPYLCVSGACNGSCTSDKDCAYPNTCQPVVARGISTGRCGPKANGQPCADNSECNSLQCVDGFCCENSCTGACRSCGIPGTEGRCLSVAANAADPHGTCVDKGKATCATNGQCDGSGACQKYPSGSTVCAPETCVTGSYTPPSTCNASGQCESPLSISCSPYICSGSACTTICTTDKDCVSGKFCVSNSCGKRPPGAICSVAADCDSNFCAQGVCCNSACDVSCEACNLSSSLGTCSSVADGSPDPQGKCKVSTQSTCQTTGACKSGACAYFDKGKNCGAALCSSSSSETPASACDGAGKCVTPNDITCGTFTCSGTACLTSCTQDKDCVPPTTCSNNTCGLKPIGVACTTGNQCVSGHCTEGVCCDTACSDDSTSGLCMTCKLTGKVGTCLPVALGGSDPKGRCTASDLSKQNCSNAGTCNGSGACSFRTTKEGCRTATCTTSGATPTTFCDGKGNCPAAPAPTSCKSYACDSTNTTCLNTCSKNADCVGTTCNLVTNNCGDKLSVGKKCDIGTDCDSGNCVDSVCCNSPCTGACQACGTGQCLSIAKGSPPRSTVAGCTASTTQCGNTGNCDGAGNCEEHTTCNDGNACTQTDACNQSTLVCVGSNTVTCSPSDACHAAGTCNTSTGVCTTPAKADGSSCSDANACTQTDTCQAGACVGGNPVVCTASDQCHTAGTCAPATGVCSNPTKANGTTCNDGNSCTKNDVCASGVCGGTTFTCAAPDQCHQAGTCNGDGTCSFANKPTGTACPDGNVCNGAETCNSSGTCQPGTPLTVDDGNPCTTDACDPTNGVKHTPVAAGTSCSDSNVCNGAETCNSGGT